MGQNGLVFSCRKQPATGSKAMVVTNHPLASGAAAQMLLEGGNAIDAAVAAFFALTVVEPMMIGVLGGGLTHLRTAEGQHRVIDALSVAPAAATPDLYSPVSDSIERYRETHGRANEWGALAVAVPGALSGWCSMLEQYGSLSLADVIAPAERLARRGFTVTPYLATNAALQAEVIRGDKGLARLFLPGERPIEAGARLIQSEYAETLSRIGREGPAALYGGTLGDALVEDLRCRGGIMSRDDLLAYRSRTRDTIHGHYRGFEIVGPPPPASSGVHIVQMLNLLEHFDIAGLRFGSAESIHLLAEVLDIAFADRAFATADPDFVDVPVATLVSKAYADARRAEIDLGRARQWSAGLLRYESADTTHLTIADAQGNIVSSTHTINGLFGACVQIEGTGMLANNYMYNFDPRPGLALSVAPGKRVFTSMAPMMLLRDGRPVAALGLPGGLRIFPSAMQALVNLIDHGMSLQEAVEAPRVWTEGGVLELEDSIPASTARELEQRGHRVIRVPRVAGGMNAIGFGPDGTMTGAACWRADGTPIGISGGLARTGVDFSIA
jgi:gamma-glutamyltranspeptidase/glutathione hydrolase